jgi:hypothetical protein
LPRAFAGPATQGGNFYQSLAAGFGLAAKMA